MEQGDEFMIKPEDFYTPEDAPGKRTTAGMWRSIQRQTEPLQATRWFVNDGRSFLLGMATTIVVGLALVGAWTLARQTFESAQPQPLRLERAYVSAINEFEQVLPVATAKVSQTPQSKEEMTQRAQQLSLVDAAISQLRLQTNGTDLSPLIRGRLRQLYALKLQILQQMIEKGEIEL
jgi:hypothetical protein